MRSHTTTMSVEHERFAVSRISTRNKEPEVFTFECAPAQATAMRSWVPIKPKKRCTRVMYPAKVRMHLPPPERSQAKRWLVILCLVVLWQIYTEEPCESPAGDYQGFPLQGPDEEALKLADLSCSSELLPATQSGLTELLNPDTTCPTRSPDPEDRSAFEQSAGKSYMVALLVYHRLGTDN